MARSVVWSWFKEVTEDKMKVRCKLCEADEKETIIVRGKTIKDSSTKPMLNHVKFAHRKTNLFIYRSFG